MDNIQFKTEFNNMRAGSIDSFNNIYNEMKKPVYTIIYRLLLNKYDSEDILQDLFLRLYKLSPEYKIDNPRAYIFMMARNMALDKLKEKKVDELTEETIDYENSYFDDKVVNSLSLDDALSKLDIKDREIITLRINGEMKFREIASMMNLPLGTVLTKYSHALSTLKKLMKGEI